MTLLAKTPEAQATADTLAAYENDLKFPELTRHDRCDSCGAAAVSQAHIASVETNLLFCGHHIRNLRAALEAGGYAIQLPAEDAEQFTWASHNKPWPNTQRDAGSAV